jgi:hypothetical protein
VRSHVPEYLLRAENFDLTQQEVFVPLLIGDGRKDHRFQPLTHFLVRAYFEAATLQEAVILILG